jgi:hypothetical protein
MNSRCRCVKAIGWNSFRGIDLRSPPEPGHSIGTSGFVGAAGILKLMVLSGFVGMEGFCPFFGTSRQVVTRGLPIKIGSAGLHWPNPLEAKALGGQGSPFVAQPTRKLIPMRRHLKLYTGEESTTVVAEPEVTVSLGDIAEILADAVKTRRAWVRDFADDRIQVSADLYDVLSTYWNMRRGA